MNWNNRLLTISEEATVAQAAQLMAANNIGSLVVVNKNHRFVGILSERDMLGKICAGNETPATFKVVDIMTTSVITCSMDTAIAEAERLMDKNHIRHLPIIDMGEPIGMLSSRDTISYRLNLSKEMRMAAEELAMLPAGMKSLDLRDVITMAIREIPKGFGADHAVLYFKTKDDEKAKIFQNNCQYSRELLSEFFSELDDSQEVKFWNEQTCSGCGESTAKISRMIIPLFIQDRKEEKDASSATGFLCMCLPSNANCMDDQTQLYKATIVQQVLGANLANALLYNSYKEARRNSETDPLTGVGTRRVLEKVLKTECARAARYGSTFSVAIADLDFFKQINDTAGHAEGDKTLKDLAGLMQQASRDSDLIVARYGGDEFVMVLPETPVCGAQIVMDRIRQKFNAMSVPDLKTLSISCGVAEWSNDPADTPETIMQRADACLYEAKNRGRNCVVASSELLVTNS